MTETLLHRSTLFSSSEISIIVRWWSLLRRRFTSSWTSNCAEKDRLFSSMSTALDRTCSPISTIVSLPNVRRRFTPLPVRSETKGQSHLAQRRTNLYAGSARIGKKMTLNFVSFDWTRSSSFQFTIDNQSLNISKATMYDAGTYTCVIENSLGSLNRSFQLIVQGRSLDRPVFISKSSNYTLYEGDNITLECYFYSDSSPFIQWFVRRKSSETELEFLKVMKWSESAFCFSSTNKSNQRATNPLRVCLSV